MIKKHKRHKYTKIKRTKMSNDFNEIYNYVENEFGHKLEITRKTLRNSLIIFFILFAIPLSIIMPLALSIGSVAFILVLLFIPALKYVEKYEYYKTMYIVSFKENIIKNFINYLNPNLIYDQRGRDFLLDCYLDAEFKDRYYTLFVSDDYIKSSRENNVSIDLCNFSLETVSSKNEFLWMIYEGIFSITNLNTNLPNDIRIKINKLLFKRNNNKIEMDYPEFERYFDVFCKSNILAMQVLTHDVMEELIKFYSTYEIDFEISIKDNHIYIRFDTGAMFEPNIFGKSHNKKTLWIYYNVLNFCTNLTTQINKSLETLEV